MNRETNNSELTLAGVVQAFCTCCSEPQMLKPIPELDAARLVCPESNLTYLDRGDGWYEQDGASVEYPGEQAPQSTSSTTPDVISDRPSKTGPKTRIALERATFA